MTPGLLSLARPWWLLGLPLLALLCWRLWRAADDGATSWRSAIDNHLLPHLLVGAAPPRWRLSALACGGLIALLALAGPVLDVAPVPAATRVLVLDLSPQMTPVRLERVRLKLLSLLRALPDGQTALIVYAGEPYLVVPPTTDAATIALFVPDLEREAVPVPGNRPAPALRMASGVLKRNAATVRDVLWISAGGAEAGVPDAMPAGIRLNILQAGTDGSQILENAARQSGGTMVQMRADDSDVLRLSAALSGDGGLNTARAIEHSGTDIGYWLLPLLLPLAALGFRRGVLALLIAPVMLAAGLLPRPAIALGLPLPAPLANYWAWRQLEAGQPAAAAERFADPRWQAAAYYRAGRFELAASLLEGQKDADSHYNRGNALAWQGRLTDALAAYEAALRLRPGDADIVFNRDLVRRLLNQGGGAGRPPPPAGSQVNPAAQEAARVAEQWLRRVPDRPGTLLRRKLQLEHQRRQAGIADRSW